MIGHAHLDPVWLWSWREGYQEARATLASAVQLLGEDDRYVFTMEQMVLLDWVRESDPPLFARVQELVAAGRIEIVGGWWVEPDCNLPALESFIRQGLIGQRFALDHFGVHARVGFNADPFGHSGVLPQILAKQRLDAYCFLRPGPHELAALDETLFEWESPDGTSLLAYRIPHEYCSPGGALDDHLQRSVDRLELGADSSGMVFYGVGNHGGGPTRANLRSLTALSDEGTYGRLTPSGPSRYFDSVRADPSRSIAVWDRELQRHAVGCYSAHSEIKLLNRRAENALSEAERYATLSERLHGVPYPSAALDDAWKTLLFNQFHDILPGSAIESAYDDARHQLGAVIATGDRLSNLYLQRVSQHIDIPLDERSQPVIVFNPHAYDLDVPVEVELALEDGDWSVSDPDGAPIPFQFIQPAATINEQVDSRGLSRRRVLFVASVPALGHALYRVRTDPVTEPRDASPFPDADPVWARTTSSERVTVDGLTLANGFVTATVDETTGWLSRLTVRSGDDTVEAALDGGRHTVVSVDESDTWGHRVETYNLPGESFQVDSVTVVEDGPLRAAIRVDSHFGQSRFTEVISLSAGSPTVDVEVELDWREKTSVMKLRVPTTLSTDRAEYQLQYGSVIRPADGDEVPGQSWVSVVDEAHPLRPRVTVINDAKYAYDASGGDIGITIARSPVFAWHDPKTLSATARYSYQDQGIQRFRYRVLASIRDLVGDEPVASVATRTAEVMNLPARTTFESFHPGDIAGRRGLVDGLPAGVALTALKPWEDDPSATVLRVVNDSAATKDFSLRVGFLSAERDVPVRLDPFQILTLVVPAEHDEPAFEVDLLELVPGTNPDWGAV